MMRRKIDTEVVTKNSLESLKYVVILKLRSLSSYYQLRNLNEKIFPILSVTEMNGSFYNNFTSNLGFAVLAFLDRKLVINKNADLYRCDS